MKSLNNYINESQDKYFSKQEIEKIKKDMWNKNGLFYKFMKDKVESLHENDINDYFDQCLDDDRCATEMASYIEMIIGRNNFSLEQVQKIIKDELL